MRRRYGLDDRSQRAFVECSRRDFLGFGTRSKGELTNLKAIREQRNVIFRREFFFVARFEESSERGFYLNIKGSENDFLIDIRIKETRFENRI